MVHLIYAMLGHLGNDLRCSRFLLDFVLVEEILIEDLADVREQLFQLVLVVRHEVGEAAKIEISEFIVGLLLEVLKNVGSWRRQWRHWLHLPWLNLHRLHFVWLIFHASICHRLHRHICANLLRLQICHGSRELKLLHNFNLKLHVVDGVAASGRGHFGCRWMRLAVVFQVVHCWSFHLLRL